MDEDDVDDLEDVRQIVARMHSLKRQSKQKESLLKERDIMLRQVCTISLPHSILSCFFVMIY